jgi:hypothetical protein
MLWCEVCAFDMCAQTHIYIYINIYVCVYVLHILPPFAHRCADVEATIKFWVDGMKTHVDRQYISGSMVYTRVTFPGDFVGLRFEYTKSNEAALNPHLSSSTLNANAPIEDVQRATKAAFAGNSAQAETVVVFVDSVKEYLERIRDSGFEKNIYLGRNGCASSSMHVVCGV